MNECEAMNFQIEQSGIQKKGTYLLYQHQVVSDDVYIRVAPVKP
jgi:hypothetical protein